MAGSAAAGVVLIAGAAMGVPPLLKDGEVRQPPAAPPSPTAPVTPGPTEPAETSRQSYVLDLDEGLLTVVRDGRPTRTADTGGTTYLYESPSVSPASGAIGVPASDAEWLYGQLRAGMSSPCAKREMRTCLQRVC
ncbi:hypothetical protein [Streptomyces sp. PR69]|uniref:hypothetical protein n=1 Tax=Streptomyces sp. PR69 TaxID=2984950 RepID=UPI002264E150|nr:hypothetical protein [Streptomyces sp. PR69]